MPEYVVKRGKIVDATTGQEKPAHVPYVILVASDAYALRTLVFYREACRNLSARWLEVLDRKISYFTSFREKYPSRINPPDISSEENPEDYWAP